MGGRNGENEGKMGGEEGRGTVNSTKSVIRTFINPRPSPSFPSLSPVYPLYDRSPPRSFSRLASCPVIERIER